MAIAAEHLGRFWFGVGYYPEWETADRWQTDAKLMQEIGLDCVRLGDFAWSRMEPRDGQFEFDWLKEVIQVLGEHGIQTMLNLPTSAPPRWLTLKHPEIMPVRRDGSRMPFGSRNHACLNAPAMHEHTIRLLRALLSDFADHPHVFSWGLGNEIGKHFECFCGICLDRFQSWLENRYRTISALNDNWGTTFWSQEYGSFDEIVLPLERPNPSLQLDWQRFRSHSLIAYCNPQIELIHQKAPGRPVTMNFRLAPDRHDCFDLAGKLDVVGGNYYPGPMTLEESRHSTYLDLFRGIRGQEPFWILEAQVGRLCMFPKEDFQNSVQNVMMPSQDPGMIRLWSYASVAAGANMLNYYCWNPSPHGDEQLSGGVMEPSGKPRKRIVKEIADTVNELRALEMYSTEVVRSEVAIVFDYESWWANNTYRLAEPFSHLALREELLHTCYDLGVPCDITSASQLDGYKLLIVPNLQIVTQAMKESFEAFVAGGGHVLFTFRSGLRLEDNRITNEPLPGRLRDLLGLEFGESEPIMGTDSIRLKIEGLSEPVPGRTWQDSLTLQGAKALGWYADGYMAGSPSYTGNDFKVGRAYYLSSLPDRSGLKHILGAIMQSVGVKRLAEAPKGVVIGQRSGPDGRIIFLINYNKTPAVCRLKGRYTIFTSGELVPDEIEIPKSDVLVLKCEVT